MATTSHILAPEPPADNLDLAVSLLTSTYQDARARHKELRGSALVALALFSTFVAVAGPVDIARLGLWAIPVSLLCGVGLVTALAVLLPTQVSIPYDTAALESPDFVHAEPVAAKESMLQPLSKAETETRRLNTRAAQLMDVSLSCFVAAVVMVSFQLSIGAKTGSLIGLAGAAIVVTAAHIARALAFALPKQPR